MKQGRYTIFLSVIIVLVTGAILPLSVQAKKTIGDSGAALEKAVAPTGLPKYEVATYVGMVAQWIFGITGLIFFGLMVYAGMLWFIARGEEEKIAEARRTIIAAIIGLAVSTGAFAIATFVSSATGLN